MAAGGDGLDADDVLVTPGAAAALFCTATSLLEPGDHAVVVRTNYATNLETPRAIGADVDVVDLEYGAGWDLDLDHLAARVKPGVTRLISITCPHNPTGTLLAETTLHGVIDLAERSGAVLLVDETYRDLTHGESAAAGRHPLDQCGQRVLDVEGVRPPRACAWAGPSAATPGWPRHCWPPRSRS